MPFHAHLSVDSFYLNVCEYVETKKGHIPVCHLKARDTALIEFLIKNLGLSGSQM